MRPRGIPPRTLGTLMARRAAVGPRPAANSLTWNLVTLRERLREVLAAGSGPRSPGVRPLRRGVGGAGGGLEAGGPAAGCRHGRVYRRPAGANRSTDLLIPPRPGAGRGLATHAVLETAGAYVVRIRFPSPVRLEEVGWELHGDVLEVEYRGRAFSYHHAFLVPPNVEPRVEQGERGLTFHFPRRA